jgi:hypothetical protein
VKELAVSSVMGKFPTNYESSSISKTLRYNVQLLCMLALQPDKVLNKCCVPGALKHYDQLQRKGLIMF